MENSNKYEKMGVYLAAISILLSIFGGVIYVSVSLAKMEIKLDLLERVIRTEERYEMIDEKMGELYQMRYEMMRK